MGWEDGLDRNIKVIEEGIYQTPEMGDAISSSVVRGDFSRTPKGEGLR